MVPSALSPTCMSLDVTAMAGIEIETGVDCATSGPAVGLALPTDEDGAGIAPTCAGPGWGGCRGAAPAPPSTLPPAATSATPPASAAIRRFDQAVIPRWSVTAGRAGSGRRP